jgi:hypothetical protein
MPYIARDDRPPLDARVDALAQELASKLSRELNKDTEISMCYRESFLGIANALEKLEYGKKQDSRGKAEELAQEIFSGAQKYGYRGAWVGALDYSLTRLIQVVPAKMVKNGTWTEAFRFWVYALTAGALERAAMTVHSRGRDDWVADAIVGVLCDVKDEYKRRVNIAYEAIQIKKSGDCYDARYRTEVVEVKDDAGSVAGYEEIMKDFGSA